MLIFLLGFLQEILQFTFSHWRYTVVQHCRTSDLELTATCRIKLRLSLYFQIQT